MLRLAEGVILNLIITTYPFLPFILLQVTPTANRNSYRVAILVEAHTQGSVLRPQPWAGESQLRQSCCCLRAAVCMYPLHCCCLRAAVYMYSFRCCYLRAAVCVYPLHCCCLRALHFPPCHCQYIGSGSSPLPWDSLLRRRYWRGAFSDYFVLWLISASSGVTSLWQKPAYLQPRRLRLRFPRQSWSR